MSDFTIYDISLDEKRPLRQADLDILNNVYTAFGMHREAGKALMALTLAVGQEKMTTGDAWHILDSLMEWAKAHQSRQVLPV